MFCIAVTPGRDPTVVCTIAAVGVEVSVEVMAPV